MRFLSPEVQLDIFKWLTFKQLIYIQQTNNFYKIFLNKYEDKLARKKFDKLEIVHIFSLFSKNFYSFSFMGTRAVQVIMNFSNRTPNFTTFK